MGVLSSQLGVGTGLPTPKVAPAMAGLDHAMLGLGAIPPGGERVRRVIAWFAANKARALRLDATAAGIRPRELDRSGRRDLAALLRRNELAFGGLDAFIPPEHFAKPDTADRAVSTVLAAIDLAGDLAQLVAGAIVTRLGAGTDESVSITLSPKTPADIRRTIADHAVSRGVRVADHAWPIPESSQEGLGVGLDPATAFAAGHDPIQLAASLAPRLACARLSDVGPGPIASRVEPGSGRLDVTAYLVTLGATGYRGHVALDLAGLRDPARVVARVF